MDWLKLMCNVLDHRKIKTFHHGRHGNNFLLLWIAMLIEAGKSDRGGYLMISDNSPYTIEDLNMITHIPIALVKKGTDLFIKLGMIDTHDGAFFIKNWSKYQSEDKLKARRENDRIRQQRCRDKERLKIMSPPHLSMSRDSHTALSRDITTQNREDKNKEKQTTEQIRLLLKGTLQTKISNVDLKELENRHGSQILLQAVEIAIGTFRKNGEEPYNLGGYLQSLCTSMTANFAECNTTTKAVNHLEMMSAAETLKVTKAEEEKTLAMDMLWNSMSDDQREEYCKRASPNFSTNIKPSLQVNTILAKLLAWEEMQPGNAEKISQQCP